MKRYKKIVGGIFAVSNISLKWSLLWTAFLCLIVIRSPLSFMVRDGGNGFSDDDITRAVETDLKVDKIVSAHLIDVRTENGVVTLSGSVHNILSRDRSEKIAFRIKGVRSVINMIKVKPVERTDKAIQEDVIRALKTDPAANAYKLGVKVENALVTLYGTVESLPEKEISLQVVKGVKGIKGIIDDISVSLKEDRPDHEIKAEIKGQLEWDPYICEDLISVSVKNKRVTMVGTVMSGLEKSYALNHARISGVESVDGSKLKVKWDKLDDIHRIKKFLILGDHKIKKALKGALIQDPRVYSFDVEVEVEDGIVNLTGVVDNLKAKKAADRDGRNTWGVVKVKNFIRVRPVDSPSDGDIARNIKDALVRNPVVGILL